jgi:hypothetical protein
MSPQSSDFVDPRERLVDEYQRAVEDLRRDLGDPQTYPGREVEILEGTPSSLEGEGRPPSSKR